MTQPSQTVSLLINSTLIHVPQDHVVGDLAWNESVASVGSEQRLSDGIYPAFFFAASWCMYRQTA